MKCLEMEKETTSELHPQNQDMLSAAVKKQIMLFWERIIYSIMKHPVSPFLFT